MNKMRIQLTYMLALLLFLLLLTAAPLLAQESAPPNAFGVLTTPFTLSFTRSSAFYYERTMRECWRLRVGIGIDIYRDSNQENSRRLRPVGDPSTYDHSTDLSNEEVDLSLMLLHTTPVSRHLTLTAGAGVFGHPSWSNRDEQSQANHLPSYPASRVTRDWGVGIQARIGAEWALGRGFALFTEYGVLARYQESSLWNLNESSSAEYSQHIERRNLYLQNLTVRSGLRFAL